MKLGENWRSLGQYLPSVRCSERVWRLGLQRVGLVVALAGSDAGERVEQKLQPQRTQRGTGCPLCDPVVLCGKILPRPRLVCVGLRQQRSPSICQRPFRFSDYIQVEITRREARPSASTTSSSEPWTIAKSAETSECCRRLKRCDGYRTGVGAQMVEHLLSRERLP